MAKGGPFLQPRFLGFVLQLARQLSPCSGADGRSGLSFSKRRCSGFAAIAGRVVGGRVMAHAIGLKLEHGRTLALAGALDGFGGRRLDGERVVAVHLQAVGAAQPQAFCAKVLVAACFLRGTEIAQFGCSR